MQESETEKRQLQKGTSAESVFSPSKHAVLYQITPIEFALDTAELKGIKKSGCHKLAKALSLPGGSIHPCRLRSVNVAATMTTNEMNSDLPSPIQIPPYPWLTMSHHVPPIRPQLLVEMTRVDRQQGPLWRSQRWRRRRPTGLDVYQHG